MLKHAGCEVFIHSFTHVTPVSIVIAVGHQQHEVPSSQSADAISNGGTAGLTPWPMEALRQCLSKASCCVLKRAA